MCTQLFNEDIWSVIMPMVSIHCKIPSKNFSTIRYNRILTAVRIIQSFYRRHKDRLLYIKHKRLCASAYPLFIIYYYEAALMS